MLKITNDALYYSYLGEEGLRHEIETKFLEDFGKGEEIMGIPEEVIENMEEEEFIEKMKDQIDSELANQMKKIPDKDLPNFLNDLVEFSDDLKFSRLFELIFEHNKIFNIIFKNNLHGTKIKDFVEDFNTKPNIKEKVPITLLIFWFCIHEVFFEKDEVDCVIIHEIPTFSGIVNLEETEKNIAKEAIDIAVSYASLGDLKDYNIKIDCSIEFNNYNENTEELETVFFADYKFFTLFDIIGAILDEITRNGKPSERNVKKKDLENKITELNKNIISNTEGKGDTLVIEHINNSNKIVNNKINKKLEALKIEELIKEQEIAAKNEDYERAAKIRDIIKENKKII